MTKKKIIVNVEKARYVSNYDFTEKLSICYQTTARHKTKPDTRVPYDSPTRST